MLTSNEPSNTRWLAGILPLSKEGYILCNRMTLQTEMPGVFVVGDCRAGAAMQLATACADGVVAALLLKQHFRSPQQWAKASAEHLGGAGW